jgi:lipopolysaccharide assembly protein A
VRILTWTIRIVLFVLLVAAAAKNVEPVRLRFFFDIELQTPLVLLLLAAFALGAFFGVLALLTTVLRQRREISILKKPAQPAPPPV